jgi:hypothetical protein
MSSPHLGLKTRFYYRQTVADLLVWGALSDGMTGPSFTIATGPRQRSNSWVLIACDSGQYFTVSDSRLPQPGGPGPRIYIPQALRPHFVASYDPQDYGTRLHTGRTTPRYIAPARAAQKTSLPLFSVLSMPRKQCVN